MRPADSAGDTSPAHQAERATGARIALTGATGFIGRRLAALLAARGYGLRCLSRPRARPPALPAGAERVSGHLGEAGALAELVRGVDCVVNCAGAVRGARRADFDAVNLTGLRCLAEQLRRFNPHARLIHLSSLAARRPELSHYARSKRLAEDYLLGEAGGLDWVALRPPAVYGPGDREILPLFKAMARGFLPTVAAPDARLSLLYVDDLGAALQACFRAPGASGQVLEVHDGRPGGYAWTDIAAAGERVFGRRVRLLRLPAAALAALAQLNAAAAPLLGRSPMLTPGKLRELRNPDWVCDNGKLRERVDWTPGVELEAGIRATLGACAGIPANR